MSKKLILFPLVFVFSVFFVSSHLAFASVSINEIMYDVPGTDTDHEWVELYNDGASSVDITGWKFNDGSSHGLNNPPANGGQGSLIIPAGSYAVLSGNAATFVIDHPGYSGTVVDTVMSLNNTGATLQIIKSDNSVADTVTYNSAQGASGDGNSLQLVSGSWSASAPTPGAVNQAGTPATQSSSNSSSASGTSGLAVHIESTNTSESSQSTGLTTSKNKTPEEVKIRTQIIANNYAFVRIPATLESEAFGHNKEGLNYGKYFWNFGDGDSKKITGNNLSSVDKITHTYFYPGTYNVTLEYYTNYYSDTPDATDKLNITVVPPDISISNIGDEKDFFIELTNNTAYGADISGWVISSSSRNFILPKNTTIESKKKIILSAKVTGFNIGDKDTLKLITPENDTAFDYNAPALSLAVEAIPAPENKVIVAKAENIVDTNQVQAATLSAVSNEDLSATVSSAEVVKNTSSGSYTSSIIAIIFIGVCAGGVYSMRRNKILKISNDSGEDFNILEE